MAIEAFAGNLIDPLTGGNIGPGRAGAPRVRRTAPRARLQDDSAVMYWKQFVTPEVD